MFSCSWSIALSNTLIIYISNWLLPLIPYRLHGFRLIMFIRPLLLDSMFNRFVLKKIGGGGRNNKIKKTHLSMLFVKYAPFYRKFHIQFGEGDIKKIISLMLYPINHKFYVSKNHLKWKIRWGNGTKNCNLLWSIPSAGILDGMAWLMVWFKSTLNHTRKYHTVFLSY